MVLIQSNIHFYLLTCIQNPRLPSEVEANLRILSSVILNIGGTARKKKIKRVRKGGLGH